MIRRQRANAVSNAYASVSSACVRLCARARLCACVLGGSVEATLKLVSSVGAKLSSEVASHSPTLPGSEGAVKHQPPSHVHNDESNISAAPGYCAVVAVTQTHIVAQIKQSRYVSVELTGGWGISF